MPWLELRIDTHEQQVAGLEQALNHAGALAVTFADAGDQPILEPDAGSMPLWGDVRVIALFDATTDVAETESAICRSSDYQPQQFRWDILEDRIWEREWLKHQKPEKFGDAFWVYHEKIEGELPTLLLDPGLAFGTGSHPTTALCLEWIAESSMSGKSILDYGCGSGILAVAALLMGADSAIGIDIDPQALDATRSNAKRNRIPAEKLAVFFPDNAPGNKVDLIFANILAGPLMKLAPELADKLIGGGSICLSGILREQTQDILHSYAPWFDDLDATCSGDWVRITGLRNQVPARAAESTDTFAVGESQL